MNKLFIVNWLRNISIARKLYFTVGLMALLIAIELFTLMFSIKTLSSVRALVAAEGLWSKAQKDAVFSLQKYARSRDEKDYAAYEDFLKVPLGDRKTLVELSKKEPNMDSARQGFLEGRTHPDDIEGSLKIFVRFNQIYYIKHATSFWVKGDSMISQLQLLGAQLHGAVNSTNASQSAIDSISDHIYAVNEQLTHVEDDFSYTLGEGSRWLADIILKLLFVLVLTVEVSGLTITIFVSRGIATGLNEIIGSARKIAKGDFTTRARVFSRDEIGILANSFNEMTDKLESNINALKDSEEELKVLNTLAAESVVIKDHFLANVSHEIRTPMNAVMGFTNLLADTELSEQQREFVKAIEISGQNLMTIINDILDYSKIESGMIVIEEVPLDIRSVFGSLEVLLQQKARDKNLELRFEVDARIPQVVMGDPIRLNQILLNLGENAVKFTEKGWLDLSVRVMKETAESYELEFTVKDSGKGIPEDKHSVIFERFTQASTDTTRRYGGTGLGLSIVKNLVELQQGSISLKSEEGKGSSFSFTLTYKKARQEEASVPPEAAGTVNDFDGRPLQILLAEDNQVNQTLAVLVLQKFGFKADIADNGRLAVEKLRQKPYDLILMDMQMPEMDGYEATRIIREEMGSQVPIIALTAHAMKEEREKCLRLGMNDYISKPFQEKELFEKITAFFQG
jgi:signal transduction histidine kinase